MPDRVVNVRIVCRQNFMPDYDEMEVICDSPIVFKWGCVIATNGDHKMLIPLDKIIRIEAF